MPVAPPIGFVGVAKEATPGTGVAATAFIPVRVNRILKDEIAQLDDDGMRGSMISGPYDQVAGPQWATFEASGPFYPDSVPWFLACLLGTDDFVASRSVADAVTNGTTVVTSATAAFTQKDVGALLNAGADFSAGTYIVSVQSATSITISAVALTTGASKTLIVSPATTGTHSFTIKNTGQPTTLSITDWYGMAQARQMPFGLVEEFTINFSGDKLVEYAAKMSGFPTAQVTKPTNAVGAVTPHPGWEIAAYLAGTLSAVVVSGSLTFKRAIDVIHTTDGSANPYKVFVGGLDVTGKLSLVAEDDSEYQRYLNHSTPSITLRMGHGSGATAVATTIVLSKCNVKHSQPKHDGVYMAWEDDLQGLWNATDAGSSGGVSPVRVNVMNAIATGTYQ